MKQIQTLVILSYNIKYCLCIKTKSTNEHVKTATETYTDTIQISTFGPKLALTIIIYNQVFLTRLTLFWAWNLYLKVKIFFLINKGPWVMTNVFKNSYIAVAGSGFDLRGHGVCQRSGGRKYSENHWSCWLLKYKFIFGMFYALFWLKYCLKMYREQSDWKKNWVNLAFWA